MRLLGRATTEQLDAIAASAIARPLVLTEVFRRMAVHLHTDRALSVHAVGSMRIGCCSNNEYERFQTVIDGGSCVTDTQLDSSPRITLTIGMADFLRLATGTASPTRLLIGRRLRIRGDLRFALRMASLFDIPAA
ncbi:MAG TPA: SCP2 sterol-binding domain-containing protein [Pseudonocardiaceae bacterium]|nr:SCP2 sterol-binding domain-containing protein [Pseudonocardiaceae bacterium]